MLEFQENLKSLINCQTSYIVPMYLIKDLHPKNFIKIEYCLISFFL